MPIVVCFVPALILWNRKCFVEFQRVPVSTRQTAPLMMRQIVLCCGSESWIEEHVLALHGFKALATGRSVRRLPMRLRSSADAVRELQITSWDTRTSI